jgi:hypothetical protein
MSSAWFGLLGVVVGAVIASVWSWLAVVRQELTDAMVAARLVDEDLGSLFGGETPHINTEVWVTNRAALARVLGREQWTAVADVYRGVEGCPAHGAVQRPRDTLAPLVAGKRYIVPQRWRNMLGRRR